MVDSSIKARARAPGIAAIAAAVLLSACGQEVTGPREIRPAGLEPRAIVVTPGLSVYTDRTSWEAAVATAGGTVVNTDFTGMTTGRVTQLVTDYGPFKIVVDDVGASSFNNPGIDIFPDAGCSLGTGDCDVFTFNMFDPTSLMDGPKINQLVFPQNIIAFGGDFIQAGATAGGTPVGPVTLRIGSESVVINTYLDASGNGFFGFVATAADTISYTFVKSGTIQNDILQVFNPAYANAPPADADTPEEMIADLADAITGLGLPSGLQNAFNSKLNSALAALAAGDTATACGSLQALANQASAQSGKKLSPAGAAMISAAVGEIREAIGC
jgi:hypothetical protein